jgi:hypothetical protein
MTSENPHRYYSWTCTIFEFYLWAGIFLLLLFLSGVAGYGYAEHLSRQRIDSATELLLLNENVNWAYNASARIDTVLQNQRIEQTCLNSIAHKLPGKVVNAGKE